MNRSFVQYLVPLCLMLFVSVADAECRCGMCGDHCHQQQLVKMVIRVPTCVVENRVKSCVVETMKEREEKYTTFKRVPVKRTYNKETCYLDDEIKTKMITQKTCKRVELPVQTTYAVNVPVKEIREGVRHRKVCGKCGVVCCVEEPCLCEVTRIEKGIRSKTCTRDAVVFEEVQKEIDYCVKVPKKHTEFCAEETVYKLEPVTKTRKVQVCVPEIVKTCEEVYVTKMLPKVVYCCASCVAVQRAREQSPKQAREDRRDAVHSQMRMNLQERQQKHEQRGDKRQDHWNERKLQRAGCPQDPKSNCRCQKCQGC